MDEKPPLYHRMAIRIHLMMCRYCSRFYRQMIFLRRLSRHDGDDLPGGDAAERLPEAARQRIKKAIQAQT